MARTTRNIDTTTRRPQPGGTIPNPNASGTAGLDFLKTSNCAGAKEIEFAGLPPRANPRGRFGPEMIFAVSVKGKAYAFSVREGSENHVVLYEKFNGGTPNGPVRFTLATTRDGQSEYIELEK